MSAPATLTHGPDFTPASVHHATAGHTWMVWEVLEHWETPANASERLRTPGVVESWRLEVSGPLPGRPGERGRFTMLAVTYGNRPGWWISPVSPG